MNENTKNPVEIDETALDAASGGILIGLLLPAVQKVNAPAQPSSYRGATTVNQGVLNAKP